MGFMESSKEFRRSSIGHSDWSHRFGVSRILTTEPGFTTAIYTYTYMYIYIYMYTYINDSMNPEWHF